MLFIDLKELISSFPSYLPIKWLPSSFSYNFVNLYFIPIKRDISSFSTNYPILKDVFYYNMLVAAKDSISIGKSESLENNAPKICF